LKKKKDLQNETNSSLHDFTVLSQIDSLIRIKVIKSIVQILTSKINSQRRNYDSYMRKRVTTHKSVLLFIFFLHKNKV